MDLNARFQGVCDAALFAAECVEDAHHLGALDTVLKPWVRAEIAAREGNMSWCDNRQDVAVAVDGVISIAPAYSRLRRELFSDLHHLGRPEAPWRRVGAKLAVRAPLQVWRRRPQYALRLLDPGVDLPGAQTWEFHVFTLVGEGTAIEQATSTHRVMSFRDEAAAVTVQVTPEFEEQRELYEELGYAFEALGIRTRLAAIHDPGS